MKRLFKNHSGFTLLEIIIAIGILAAMTFTMTEITSSIMAAQQRARERNETRHSTAVTLLKISDDLKMAFQSDVKFFGTDKFYQTGFKGDQTSMNFSTLSNTHYVKNKNETDHVHAGYYLAKNEAGSENLVRRQTDHLTDDLEKGGVKFVLLKSVQAVEFAYYDSNKKEWQDKWDTDSVSSVGRLPQIVRIRLTVLGEPLVEDEEGRREYFYEMMAPIELYDKKVTF